MLEACADEVQSSLGRLKLAQRYPTSHMNWTPLSRSKGQGHQATVVDCSSDYIIYMDDIIFYATTQIEPLLVDHEYLWHKAPQA